MGFVIQWLAYLLAYGAGSAVAWVVVTKLITQSNDGDVMADVSDSGETGAP